MIIIVIAPNITYLHYAFRFWPEGIYNKKSGVIKLTRRAKHKAIWTFLGGSFFASPSFD